MWTEWSGTRIQDQPLVQRVVCWPSLTWLSLQARIFSRISCKWNLFKTKFALSIYIFLILQKAAKDSSANMNHKSAPCACGFCPSLHKRGTFCFRNVRCMKCKSAKNLPPNCSGTRQGSLGPCEGGAGLGGGEEWVKREKPQTLF